MPVKKITEVDASEEVKDGAYLLTTQQETAEDGTVKETLVRTALAAIGKALGMNKLEVKAKIETVGAKQVLVVMQGEKDVARLELPGMDDDYNTVTGENNSVSGHGVMVGGVGNTVGQCAEGAIIAGSGMTVSDSTIVAAFGTADNAFTFHTDGTIKAGGVSVPKSVVFNIENDSESGELSCHVYINGSEATFSEIIGLLRTGSATLVANKPDTYYGGAVTVPNYYSAKSWVYRGASRSSGVYFSADFDNYQIDYNSSAEEFVVTQKEPVVSNISNGTGAGSVTMRNVPAITEPDDAGTGNPPEATAQPQANGKGAFAVGIGTVADGDVSVAEGINTKAGYVRSDGSRNVGNHAEGIGTYAKSSGTHAEGYHTQALASNSHTEGFENVVNADAWSGHAEGRENEVNSRAGHAEGYKNKIEADAEDSHVEGQNNTLSGVAGHAEGQNNKVSGEAAHVEGSSCAATGKYSHAEGRMSKASGWGSHAEGAASTDGTTTEATAKGSHAEGVGTKATGADAHAEGALTEASGAHSHAEGLKTKAAADYSHAGGACNETREKFSTVIGKYAKVIENGSGVLFAVGNGTSATKRSTAFEVHADGSALLGGKVVLTMADYNALLAKINALADRVAALEGATV